MLSPPLLGLRGPGRYIGSAGSGDGGFEEPPVPIIGSGGGDVTIKGKVKTGSFGKFVYPLAIPTAGFQYSVRYTPHFTQLAQQGKLAMVGLGFKSSNDFHMVGLRGNGSSGLSKYKVYGTPPNGWNKDTGHTVVDGGAPVNGSQVGPNYIRLVPSTDGTSYHFLTSPDGVTYSTEFSSSPLTPFANISAVETFGLAMWFNNADAGPFSVDFSLIVTAVSVPVDMILSANSIDWGETTIGTISTIGGAGALTYTVTG